MASLARNLTLWFPDARQTHTRKWVCDNSATNTFYRGSPVMIDIGADTLYVRQYAAKATGDIFIGIALEPKAIVTTDTELDNVIEVHMHGLIGFPNSASFTDADVGKPLYFSDSGTLTATVGSNLGTIGKLQYVEESMVFVMLVGAMIQT